MPHSMCKPLCFFNACKKVTLPFRIFLNKMVKSVLIALKLKLSFSSVKAFTTFKASLCVSHGNHAHCNVICIVQSHRWRRLKCVGFRLPSLRKQPVCPYAAFTRVPETTQKTRHIRIFFFTRHTHSRADTYWM